MNDEQIVELYFRRDETAIAESEKKYGAYCMKIAMNILSSELDSEECVNDVWLGAWRSIPPQRPSNLATYLGKITRNLSINRYKMKYADKRAMNEFAISLDELDECVPGGEPVEDDGRIGQTENQLRCRAGGVRGPRCGLQGKDGSKRSKHAGR